MLIGRLLDKNPENRPTVQEVIQDIPANMLQNNQEKTTRDALEQQRNNNKPAATN